MSVEKALGLLGVVADLTKGNPGSMAAMMEILASPDPRKSVLVGFLSSDEDLKGGAVYILWNDLADRDTVKALDLLYSVPLRVLKNAMMVQDYSGRQLIAPYLEIPQGGPQ